jgi:hypothetical protein
LYHTQQHQQILIKRECNKKCTIDRVDHHPFFVPLDSDLFECPEMKFSAIAKAILVSSASGISVGAAVNKKQRNLQTICSCSPQAFSFTLLLAQDCSVNTLEENPGISDTNCAIVNATTASASSFVGDDQMVVVSDVQVPIEEIIECIPWLDNCNIASDNDEPIRGRELQTGSPIPSVIISIQFIELDSDGTVIQIDNSQNNILAESGDTFSYASTASQLDPSEDISTQLDIVPKTAVLFMVGFNEDGDEIRGRFVWEYTNGCGIDEQTITGGEDYGWISFDQVDRAIPEFCPAVNGETPAPTPVPFIIDMFPTPPPMIDTPLPTPAPTIIDMFPTPPPMIDTPLPTPAPTIIDTPFPTLSPVTPAPSPFPISVPVDSPTELPTDGNPTPSPSELLFPTLTPTDSPSRRGPLPTTQRPVSAPTYGTDEPTYFESREPVPSYGYGEDYHVSYSSGDSKSGKRGSKSAGGSHGSKSGKGSSKSGKGSSKSGKGSKKMYVGGKSSTSDHGWSRV